jgi:hypothetical protein
MLKENAVRKDGIFFWVRGIGVDRCFGENIYIFEWNKHHDCQIKQMIRRG